MGSNWTKYDVTEHRTDYRCYSVEGCCLFYAAQFLGLVFRKLSIFRMSCSIQKSANVKRETLWYCFRYLYYLLVCDYLHDTIFLKAIDKILKGILFYKCGFGVFTTMCASVIENYLLGCVQITLQCCSD